MQKLAAIVPMPKLPEIKTKRTHCEEDICGRDNGVSLITSTFTGSHLCVIPEKTTSLDTAGAERQVENVEKGTTQAARCFLRLGKSAQTRHEVATKKEERESDNVTTSSAETGKTNSSTPEAMLTCHPLFELPEMWMKVAAFLGVPALGHLARTASRFRAVLLTCVSTSAAKSFNKVTVYHITLGFANC